MVRHYFPKYIFLLMLFAGNFQLNAQKYAEPKLNDSNWIKPFAPFSIAGNLYYVGTYDLACYLITTPKGNILINTGVASSFNQIKNNIERLGFKFSKIKILLNTQAHYDHLGAMAAIKTATKAQLMIDEKDAPIVEDGGSSDYELGKYGAMFRPVKIDRLLHDGDVISLGGMHLKVLHHPGHTKGSCSFLFTVADAKNSYKVLIANLPTIITDNSFDSIPAYPAIAKDYAYTLNSLKNLQFDLWCASHASQFDLHKKHQSGDNYNPEVFRDREGFDKAVDNLRVAYDEKMKRK